jgi:metal-responsive CopG/Arc/MetJ family transcriptional regulator
MNSSDAYRDMSKKVKKKKLNKFVGILMPQEMYNELTEISEDKGFLSVSSYIRTELKKSLKNA